MMITILKEKWWINDNKLAKNLIVIKQIRSYQGNVVSVRKLFFT